MGYTPPPGGGVVAVPGMPDRPLAWGSSSAPTILEGSGVMLVPHPASRRLGIYAADSEPALALAHYHAGAIPPAGTIVRRWRNNRLVSAAIGSTLEVWCDDPPGDVASGYYGLRFAGAASGEADLLLNVDGQRHYTFDLQAPVVIADARASSWSSGRETSRGCAIFFTSSTEVEVHGLAFRTEWNSDLANLPEGLRRFGVVDRNGDWLVYNDVWGSYVRGGQYRVRFPVPITLEAGEVYGFAALGLEGAYFYNSRGAGWSTGPFTTTNMNPGGSSPANSYAYIRRDAPADVTIADAIAAGPFPGPTRDPNIDPGRSYGLTPQNSIAFSAIGRTSGLAFEGDLLVTSISSGTPTVAPSGLNIRLEIAPT